MEQNAWKIFVAAWICTAIAVCMGIYFTQSPNCLWAMILPSLLTYNNDKEKEDKEESKDEELC